MLVALSAFDLRLPSCGSLKEKRRVIKGLSGGLRAKFNVAVAEVDHQDLWQRATIGVSAVAAEGYHLKKVMHEVERFVRVQPGIELLEHRTSLHGIDD